MDLIVKNPALAVWGDTSFRCAVGRNGIVRAEDKVEGDGKTPAGRWPMRQVFYRADRMAKPETVLPIRALEPDDGWCEVPGDANYNKLIKHPYPASAERMWREDELYDVVVVLGHNDAPVVHGKGSAIFLHLANSSYGGSAGCVTLRLSHLLKFLRDATLESCVEVMLP